MTTQTFIAPNLPIKSVLCFRNRAEIQREFEVTLQKGLNTIIVERLPVSLVSSSIRVDGESANDYATLRDVQYKETYSPEEENYSNELKTLIKDLDDLQEEKEKLKDKEALLTTRSKALDMLVENIVGQNPKEKLLLVDDSILQSFDKTFTYYESNQVDAKQAARALNAEKKVLGKKINDLEKRINELKQIDNHKRSVYISLDAEEDTSTILKLHYNALNASWSTAYDVRVDTKSKKLTFHYLADIRQYTGEDWKDVDLSLSTAEPEDAGQLPELPTMIAKFEEKIVVHPTNGLFGARPEVCMASFAADHSEGSSRRMFKRHLASVIQNMVSTTYSIPLPRTIPSKDDETKVPIAVKTLDYDLERQVVPSKSSTVFIVANIVNTTDLHFIEGPVKVYVDGSYANTLHMKQVSPNERFRIELGKDPNVKVEYKPKDTFQQQSGMIQKSNVTANEQKILLKNSNAQKTLVTVLDQVPKSSDERIKVKLNMPDVKRTEKKQGYRKPELGTFLNEQNILEWTVEVPAGGESELHIKYNVEYPQNETVEYVEQY